ncbi:Uu.00g027930.m01.CDS01 [Anthostomella pinea]|uniref:Uu.00g027930.m01.CDS01 n=1 Tax=Anthostomella pinea TaxID=933095 RepID=A0AAI8V7U6_9PEZI|nr:Uu.00g027930.m01.CDS01 [Anthostomella pinea]
MAGTFRFGTDLWDPSHRFETSWLVSPYVLFVLRALMALYAFTVLLFNIGYQCARPALGGCEASRSSFSYFTTLTYWGIAFYMLAAAIHTFTYARYNHSLLDRFPRPLQALHALFYSSIVTYPFLVTAVYWAILYGPSWFPNSYQAWSNISQHAMNSLFALIEIVLPRTNPMPPVHMLWLVVILACYLALAYVTHATKGFYTYSFLDPVKTGNLVAAYVFGIAVAILVIFGIVWCLVWARRWLTERKLGLDGRFAKGSGAGSWRGRDVEVGGHELGSRDGPK